MLYVFHGTDTQKTRKKMQNMVDVLLSKRPDANVFRITPDSWSRDFLDETISGINLFAPKNIIILDSLASNSESEEYIKDSVELFAESDHVCILHESKIDKDFLKKLEKKATKIEEHNIKVAGEVGSSSGGFAAKKEGPKTFALADAIVSKNRVKAWTVFQELQKNGTAAEEIHGVLWWQFKSMALAFDFSSAKAAGLSPYVFQKCQSAKKDWKHEDVSEFLNRLVHMYHRAHRGEIDFMNEIERVCLEG